MLVKPNLAEAESALRALAGPGSAPGETDAVEDVDESGDDVAGRCAAAAEALVVAGAEAALVSSGRSGAALHTGDRSWWFTAPRVPAPTGFGGATKIVRR